MFQYPQAGPGPAAGSDPSAPRSPSAWLACLIAASAPSALIKPSIANACATAWILTALTRRRQSGRASARAWTISRRWVSGQLPQPQSGHARTTAQRCRLLVRSACYWQCCRRLPGAAPTAGHTRPPTQAQITRLCATGATIANDLPSLHARLATTSRVTGVSPADVGRPYTWSPPDSSVPLPERRRSPPRS
jgi:hypothetical protein